MGITNMVGRPDEETPTYEVLNGRNRGYNAKIWFNSRNPLPVGVTVMTVSGMELYVRFIYENVPSNFYLSCYTIKHTTDECPSRMEDHNNTGA